MMKHSIYIKMKELLWEIQGKMEQQTLSFKVKGACDFVCVCVCVGLWLGLITAKWQLLHTKWP